jgi:hypothetical protein
MSPLNNLLPLERTLIYSKEGPSLLSSYGERVPFFDFLSRAPGRDKGCPWCPHLMPENASSEWPSDRSLIGLPLGRGTRGGTSCLGPCVRSLLSEGRGKDGGSRGTTLRACGHHHEHRDGKPLTSL